MDNVFVPNRYFAKDRRSGDFFFVLKRLAGVPVDKNFDSSQERFFWQIYSVQIQISDKKDLQQIYGHMMVGNCIIFERCSSNDGPYGIDSKGFVRLEGPMRPFDVDVVRDIDITLSMKDHSKDPSLNRDVHFKNRVACSRQLLYSQCTPGPSNKILSETIDTGRCGRVNVTYALFDDAAECFLTVKLLNFKGTRGAHVYGQIWTSNAFFKGDERARSLIYDREWDERQYVNPGQFIPLRRPVNVAPMGDELHVEVNLLHSHMDSTKFLVIAHGTLSFRAKCSYKSKISWRRHYHEIVESRNIIGPWGTIQVKAYWFPCWSIPDYDIYTA